MQKTKRQNSVSKTLSGNSLPLDIVSNALNNTVIDKSRPFSRENFRLHVSNVISSKGPTRFCARHQVLQYHSTKDRVGGKLTPARRLLFATGHFQHDYVVEQFIQNSDYGEFIYAKWSCEDYTENKNSPEYGKHTHVLDTLGNVTKKHGLCDCGNPRVKHNEIDLFLESLNIVGHPDMVIRLGDRPSNYKFYIYEFKTVDRQDISFDEITFVMADHKLQVSFYYKIMKALGMNVSRKLRVMYIDRSNRKLFAGYPYKELICEPELDEFLQPFIDNLRLVKQGIKSGRLPGKVCKAITDDRAKNCEMAVECFLRWSGYVTPAKSNQVHNRRRLVVTSHGHSRT